MGISVVKSEGKVQYELIRSRRRRRLALKITDEGTVVVSAPYRISLADIRRFVDSQTQWIGDRLRNLEQLPQPPGPHTYTDGDAFLFLDSPLGLKIVTAKVRKTTCSHQGDLLVVQAPSHASTAAVKRSIVSWYRDTGIRLYEGLVAKWIAEIGYDNFQQPILVDMANFPKRWGSCSQKGELRFALRSLLLPLHIVDYLALHEVAHLMHFNHGSDFKRLLDRHMPDWRDRQKEMNRLRLRAELL